MQRRVVITGGAGFLGSALVRRFLADGWAVVAVDDLCTGRAANLDGVTGPLERIDQDVSVALDVAGPVDAVLHFASPASPPDYLARAVHTLRVGSLGTMRALQLAEDRGARFLMASTSEIYGDPEVHPQVEDYWGNVNPIGPRSVYDEAKRFSEALTMGWHRERGLDTRIIRIFNTYGPRMRPDDGRIVPNFVCQALRGEALTLYGDGSQTRSFCFVDDLVEGIVRVLEHGDALPYNLGNPTEHTVSEFAELIRELIGQVEIVRLPLPEDDPKRRCPDISRARDQLGWQPTTPLREGLAETIDYFRGVI
jgi:dTDP-glucose 4,6-dehydratase